MRTSNKLTGKLIAKVGKIAIALILATILGGITASPAFSRDFYGRHEGHFRGHGHYRHYGHYGHYRHYGYQRRWHHHGYYYGPSVYGPPPVAYNLGPYQSPGISILFPFIFR